MKFFLIIFIFIPLTEMVLLFGVADRIGGLITLGLVVLTAVIGLAILKRQGLSTIMRANQRLQSGELPAQEIIEGMLLAGAGALLLTPGFITDTLGFVLLTGPLRRPIAQHIIGMNVVNTLGPMEGGNSFSFRSSSTGPHTAHSGKIYEGQYSEEEQALSGGESNKNHSKDQLP